MPEKITARYRITTPMFIGDAAQQASGISPAAVKGALRFWWRALNWGRIRQAKDSDSSALQQLHKEESELFGSAADQGEGQAKAFIRVKPENLKYGLPKEQPTSGIQYLLGQGLYHFRNGYGRTSAVLSGHIQLEMALKPGVSAAQTQQLVQAAQALGLLGALGSRARKGFGSLALESLECSFASADKLPAVPQNPPELKQLLASWSKAFTDSLPPFSAFSTQTRVDVSSISGNATELQELAGHEMQLYRSWGRNGRVSGYPAERNFPNDHDDVLDVSNNITPQAMPERGVFGLPHNYFFSSQIPSVKVDIAPKEASRNRRASPLLIHIHRFPNGSHCLVQLLLPATFLPEGEKIEFKPKPGRAVDIPFTQTQINWDTLHQYLDRFSQRERVL
ncbi:type III-B CRISPR module RAMP protein Cmr1 [Thiothrix subterranea]|uniref:Type III-B CRISPR module RAMP protein Cmr1 n=1 Tax=Thiothrix subterranea TaxID=2735563 RepID=A0AA51QZ43_9GAMM|nr:type III-B CRISPR module RAMP protein Cmr1 [Thiothrix subterranea]MDQ5767909.1 type III-B CRISPR module RAMP protein Cmr1 [Thiothrix subterranea]WML86632.1 type III-B CRISPR module RAMP protein Cmr1 [Thiothrix subterranea]